MQPNHEQVLQILGVGVRAISGYNSQPWRFELKESEVWVYLPRTKNFMLKLHGLNPMTLGFLLENLEQGARHHGFAMDVELMHSPLGLDAPYAKLRFHSAAPHTPHDIGHVLQRRTNRLAYRPEKFAPELSQTLATLAQGQSDGHSQAHLVLAQKNTLGEILADLEEVRQLNEKLMDEIANYVLPRRAQGEKSALYLNADTFGLTPLQMRLMHLYKNWPGLRPWILRTNGLGLRQRMRQYHMDGTAGYLVFTVNDEDDKTYIHLGQKIQHCLNELTRLGLDSQACLSGLYLLHLCFENPEIYSTRARDTLLLCRQDLERMFGLPDRHIAFIVRLGHAAAPVPLTPRRPVLGMLMQPK